MKKLHPAAAAVAIAVVLAIVLRRDGYSSHGPTPRFSLFPGFFWWLISDFSGGKGGTDASEAESAEKNIAFRFGRFLSRIFARN